MPYIKLGNVMSRLMLDDVPDPAARAAILEWFEDYFTFETQGFIRTPRMRRAKHVVKKHRLFTTTTGKFPTGYAETVAREARDWAQTELEDPNDPLAVLASLTLRDARTRPISPNWKADISWTQSVDDLGRDWRFQFTAVQRGVARGRGIFWIPTGGGKTEIAVALAVVLPCRWLFVVPSKDLLEQAARRYETLTGNEAGRIGDGKWTVGASFTAATYQTLARAQSAKDPRFEALAKAIDGLIIDECHTLPADSLYNVTMACKGAYFRFGISATPLARGDKKSILAIAALGRVIYRITAPELHARNVISMPGIRMPEIRQEADEFSQRGDAVGSAWKRVYDALVVKSKPRNELVVDCVRRADKPALVFVKLKKHGRILENRLRAARFSVELVDGMHESPARKAALDRLELGEIDVLVATPWGKQGIDVPEVRAIVVASSGKSVIEAIQRVGRGTRTVDGKNTVEVYDPFDRGTELLEKWSRARYRAYEREGYMILEGPKLRRHPARK